jgi:hypothetical protein
MTTKKAKAKPKAKAAAADPFGMTTKKAEK